MVPTETKTLGVRIQDATVSEVVIAYKKEPGTKTVIRGVEIKLCYEVGK